MENLNRIFIENVSTFFIVIFVLVIVLLILIISQNFKLKNLIKKQKDLFAGKNARDLEALLIEQNKHLKRSENDIKEIYETLNEFSEELQRCTKKIKVARFNPFQDVGGNQSFSIVLLNSHNSGVIISTLYSREGTRIYAKPIKKGVSEYKLTQEEEKTLKEAISS